MKTATALVLLCVLPVVLLFGQAGAPTVTITGPATAAPGATVTLSVTLSGSAGQNIAGIETNLTVPAGVTGLGATAGAASTAAAKTIDCGAAAPFICIVDGLNQTAYADGVVATFSATLPTAPGAYTFTLVPIAASLAGKGVSLGAAAPFTVTAPGPCSLTGDFPTSAADVAAIRKAIEAGTAPASFDLNGDGVVNEIDVRRVINALPAPQGTGQCVTGP